MILYMDTSASVKKYVKEEGSDEVTRLRKDAQAIAISKIGHAEAASAFCRKKNEDKDFSSLIEILKES